MSVFGVLMVLIVTQISCQLTSKAQQFITELSQQVATQINAQTGAQPQIQKTNTSTRNTGFRSPSRKGSKPPRVRMVRPIFKIMCWVTLKASAGLFPPPSKKMTHWKKPPKRSSSVNLHGLKTWRSLKTKRLAWGILDLRHGRHV